MNRVFIAAINDLATDRRLHRMARYFSGKGARVTCIGRRLPGTPEDVPYPFKAVRFRMIFRKGALFYAWFNIRLFFNLLIFPRPSLVVSCDLDTLPACFLATRLRRILLIYDSHEFFTEVPELIGRKSVRSVWKWIERVTVPRVRYAITVSPSIARIYRGLYGIRFRVIRNLPLRIHSLPGSHTLPGDDTRPLILYQGALNLGRGLELMIRTMKHLPEVRFVLAGTGDIEGELRQLVFSEEVEDRVEFLGRLAPAELVPVTCSAALGISLEEDMGLNYRYSLPNKLFDYIQCRVPVLCSDLPEMARVVETAGVGVVLRNREPGHVAGIVRYMLNERKQGAWREALEKASAVLCWEEESGILDSLLSEAGWAKNHGPDV